MTDKSKTPVKRICGLDFGSGGYVRIDATSDVGEEDAINIASDIVAWVRSMREKHRSDAELARELH